MPYKSKSQQRYFHVAESRGEISPKTVKEFNKESKGMKLPESAPKKKSRFKKLFKKD